MIGNLGTIIWLLFPSQWYFYCIRERDEVSVEEPSLAWTWRTCVLLHISWYYFSCIREPNEPHESSLSLSLSWRTCVLLRISWYHFSCIREPNEPHESSLSLSFLFNWTYLILPSSSKPKNWSTNFGKFFKNKKLRKDIW